MFKNWQTTVSGVGALLGTVSAILISVGQGHMPDASQISMLVALVSGAVGLLRAKDQNVTGGTVPQTVEAESRTGTLQ